MISTPWFGLGAAIRYVLLPRIGIPKPYCSLRYAPRTGVMLATCTFPLAIRAGVLRQGVTDEWKYQDDGCYQFLHLIKSDDLGQFSRKHEDRKHPNEFRSIR